MKDLRTGAPCKQIECYKCKSKSQLLIEEKIDNDTGKVAEKNFICLTCAGGAEKVFKYGN